MTLLLWKLIAAHFVTRFILHPNLLSQAGAQPKNASKIGILCLNSAIFLALALLLLLPGHPAMGSGTLACLIGLVALARLAIDILSLFRLFGNWQGLLIIQAMHISAMTAIAMLFGDIPGLSDRLSTLWTSPRTYGVIAMYAASMGLGSILVPLVTGSLGMEEKPGLKDAGMYIGILERLVITTLVIYWPKLDASAIGLIFGAKSIVRFPEFKKVDFAEYYLLGTLISFIIAIAAGLIARGYFPA